MIATITADGQLILSVEETEGSEPGEAKEEHATEDEAHNPILPVMSELVYAALAFFVLLALMAWKLFPAVKKAMDARSDRIRDSLDEAERNKAEASRILEDYQRQLADAKNESARIIEEARQTAEQLRKDLMARAEAEVAEFRTRANEEISAAQGRAVADVQGQIKALAVEAAQIVVQRNLDRETNEALVEQFINQVGATR